MRRSLGSTREKINALRAAAAKKAGHRMTMAVFAPDDGMWTGGGGV